jgi:hypothetical protein
MSPEVVAAIIAASVSFLTLIGTLVAQYLGRRATSRDTQKALDLQREQLDRTLTEQRTRTLNERFASAAEQLGSDKPAVRLTPTCTAQTPVTASSALRGTSPTTISPRSASLWVAVSRPTP